LVEQLLTLSRLESGAAADLDPMDMGDVVRQVAAEMAQRAIARQQQLEVAVQTACPVMGNATLLAVLVRNLMDNAIRYSPARAKVRLTAARSNGLVRLKVEDSGPGVAPADAARLGERFFRGMGTGESGSGLGWSIVRRIAAVHGARITLGTSDDLGGLLVQIEWPAAS